VDAARASPCTRPAALLAAAFAKMSSKTSPTYYLGQGRKYGYTGSLKSLPMPV
jgi:hypothetical protein